MSLICEEYTVCFKDSDKFHWFQRFLKKGFTHCHAFKPSQGGKFYVISDPTRSHLSVDIQAITEESYLELTKGCTVVKVLCQIDPNKDRGTFCRFNCVEVVKSLLGMRSMWTLTPYQLYKRLRP